MSEEKKDFELNNEELSKVSGGKFNVTYDDGCHYNPPNFECASGYGIGQGRTCCGFCVHNPHRKWQDSCCDYPNNY